ncbi:hypothetical protein SVIOM342S_04377 [Streptomyces violaceorubidus]
MEFGVLGDVLPLPGNTQLGTDLLDDELRVITQMTAGFANEGDEMVLGVLRGLRGLPAERGLMPAILARARPRRESSNGTVAQSSQPANRLRSVRRRRDFVARDDRPQPGRRPLQVQPLPSRGHHRRDARRQRGRALARATLVRPRVPLQRRPPGGRTTAQPAAAGVRDPALPPGPLGRRDRPCHGQNEAPSRRSSTGPCAPSPGCSRTTPAEAAPRGRSPFAFPSTTGESVQSAVRSSTVRTQCRAARCAGCRLPVVTPWPTPITRSDGSDQAGQPSSPRGVDRDDERRCRQ